MEGEPIKGLTRQVQRYIKPFIYIHVDKIFLIKIPCFLRMVMDDLFHLWPVFEIDYTPLFNIPYSYLPPDLKVLLYNVSVLLRRPICHCI